MCSTAGAQSARKRQIPSRPTVEGNQSARIDLNPAQGGLIVFGLGYTMAASAALEAVICGLHRNFGGSFLYG